VRDATEADLGQEPLVPEQLVLVKDLVGDLLRAADDDRALQPGQPLELVAGSGPSRARGPAWS
jgi:hypothetical protein